ncbi:MAG: porin [Flavobacteriia bacterium]|nr:porin [Flavobacteriia bacterium]
MKVVVVVVLFYFTSLITISQNSSFKIGKGVNYTSKDSLFSCNLQFRMQNRLSYESIALDDLTPQTFEFRVRRLRLSLRGFLYNPKWKYRIQLSFSRGDMDWDMNKSSKYNTSVNVVRDAIVSYAFTPNFEVTFGQTKLPGNRQRVISSGNQQFFDRSIVNATFTIDRDFGVFFNWSKNYFKLKGAITSGEGRNSNSSNKGLSYTGRIEVLPFGSFTGENDYSEGDLEREQKPKLSIAGTYNYNALAVRNGGQLGEDLFSARNIHNVHGDILFKFKGFALYNETCLRLAENPITYSSDTSHFSTVQNGYGNLTQISYLFKKNWEIAFRYAFVQPYSSIYFDSNFTSVNFKKQEQFLLGVSRYLAGHRLKYQINAGINSTYDYQKAEKLNKLLLVFQVELGI